MSEQQANSLLDLLNKLIGSTSYNNHLDIDVSSTDYVKDDGMGFFLYVGVTGTVIGKDINGNAISKTFIAGYHKVRMKQITSSGTTATNLMVLW